ncbi:hypothetical protein CPCDC_6g5500 [Cryptosporidium sp. 43IA8]|nr:hypothetical protein CPCDC_6g5500 [Cryptosporidium sp. 43IA8]
MTNLFRKPTPRGELKPAISQLLVDDETSNKEFLVVILEEDGQEFRVPFLVNYETKCELNKFERLIVLDHKSYKFYIITVNNQNSKLNIDNENGKLKFIFDTHIYSINTNKILEKKLGYTKELNQVFLKDYNFENISNRPKYYNSKYQTLVPGNFNVFQIEVEKVFAVLVPRDMKYYVDNNKCTIRMVDSSNDITYKADYGELLVEGFKMVTINIFRFRIIIAKDLVDAMINGLSELNCLSSDDK